MNLKLQNGRQVSNQSFGLRTAGGIVERRAERSA